MYKKIVVGLDGSAVSERALPHAVALAKAFASELVLLRVVSGPRSLPDAVAAPAEAGEATGVYEAQLLSIEEQEAQVYLEAIQQKLTSELSAISWRIALGSEARAIVEEAKEIQADLLVLATHGRGGLARLVLGSVAEAVVRSAPCPVFLVRVVEEHATATDSAQAPIGQLLSFEEDARKLGPLAPKPLGVRTVDVQRIVGSVGRARELGPDFRPPLRAQRRNDDERFYRIVKALERGEVLPPIEAYKLGYNYYVLDGNHRVAAAKMLGQKDIDAIVTEFLPISDEDTARVFTERRHFEALTGLTRIGATRVGHYPRLEQLIQSYAEDPTHRPTDLAVRPDGDFKEAARHWYYAVYEPVARAIRASHLGRAFPSERTADIFVHLANFREEQEHESGQSMTWDQALEKFIEQCTAGAGSTVLQRLPGLRKLLRPRVDVVE